MCPPQAQAEVGSAMTEKTELVCASSPAPPPKPASPGQLPTEEVEQRSTCTPWLPPGVPVINLGHTRPGAAVASTELSAFRPSLLQLAALGTAPPALALHYHPHPFLNRSVGSWDPGQCWGWGQGLCVQCVHEPQPLTVSTLGQQDPSASSLTAG